MSPFKLILEISEFYIINLIDNEDIFDIFSESGQPNKQKEFTEKSYVHINKCFNKEKIYLIKLRFTFTTQFTIEQGLVPNKPHNQRTTKRTWRRKLIDFSNKISLCASRFTKNLFDFQICQNHSIRISENREDALIVDGVSSLFGIFIGLFAVGPQGFFKEVFKLNSNVNTGRIRVFIL